MQKSFDVASSLGAYHVSVARNAVAEAQARFKNAVFICDRNISSYLPGDLDPIFIDAEEENKSLEAMPNIIRELRNRKADRGSSVVAVGGGITQDIATFTCSVYMRGIPWAYLPTTLLGMVDSCIGGKSSINVGDMKNLVGNFYPPGWVLVDAGFLATLDPQDIVGGLCEAVKICYARSEAGFQGFLSDGPQPPLAVEQAEAIITRSLNVKKWFIEIDEFDQKERLLLNFGHTFGHALESATHYDVKHGVGVGIGMLVAIEFQKRWGKLNDAGCRRADALERYIRSILQYVPGLAKAADVDANLLVAKFEHDKKHRADEYRVILPIEDGSLSILPLPKSTQMRSIIVEAYAATIESLRR